MDGAALNQAAVCVCTYRDTYSAWKRRLDMFFVLALGWNSQQRGNWKFMLKSTVHPLKSATLARAQARDD